MRFQALIASAMSLAACGAPEPEPVELPHADGVPYRVFLQTLQDGAYADQPFRLLVNTEEDDFPAKAVLIAEQCQNVSVALTASTIYVFYDHLVLTGFGGYRVSSNDPAIFLCDRHAVECESYLQRLASADVELRNVCTHRTRRDV